jgi:Fic family protein
VRSALVHLYFESIHPFDDGNGRVGRVLAEKILSQDLTRPVLFSLSETILANQKEYYHQLSCASRNGMDVTPWVEFFVKMVSYAQTNAENKIMCVPHK